ncbi:MAG: BACON domain-containing carbohydrate-binding protein [Gemmatimonadales bacterium]|nr:BACON domain-containing carbohydrate-binding protein [Gemmatimonadales bacterium]
MTADPVSVVTGSSARSGSIALQAACAWTAVSDAAWLRITAGSQGSASGTIQWSAEENAGTQSRTGTITVRTATAAAARVTIQQASRAPLITVDSLVNAASFRGGSISPGEILSAFGLNVGPREAVGLQTSADGRFVTTEVARVRVLVDGIPAPITYADSSQVNFIAPYGIEGRQQVDVRTEYQGLPSDPIRVPVVTANPEIFATGPAAPEGGPAQGAILNADNRPNSVANRAPRGSVIQIFATGLGATTPPGIDGYVPSTVPLPEPSSRVRVFVAGQECRLRYAGAAPFLVSGVMQINCELPLTVSGVSELSLFVGDRRNRGRISVAVE